MPVETYRISKFGTLLLTPEQQLSAFLNLKIQCVINRAVEYPNNRYIPPQNNWLYWVAVDKDFFVTYQGYAKWYRQSWLLWSFPESSVLNAICQTANDLYLEIMGELAQKPNIPPLPPSIPPLQPPFSLIPRLQAPAAYAITFFAFNNGDFDVTINWQDPPPSGQCSPTPEELDPPGPINEQLPPPAPNMPAPPPLDALNPPDVPANAPPLGGTSLIPPGFPPGYQSRPANTPGRIRLSFAATKVVNGATCQDNVSFTQVLEVDWVGETPSPGDFSLVQGPRERTSCGFWNGRMQLRYQGALFSPLTQVGPVGVNINSWPCTGVQRL